MIVYGFHSVKSAISSEKNQTVKTIYVEKGKDISDFVDKHDRKKIKIISKEEMKQLVGKSSIHQGIAADVTLNTYMSLESLKDPGDCVVAMLDSITDPHNLGAVIRSAACFGINGIILSEHNSCKINGTTAKASSGALEHVFIYNVGNLSQALNKLKNFGFWVVSLSKNGNTLLSEVKFSEKIVLVFGSEGSGIRPLQLKNSDFVAKLPTSNEFGTLNISNAAAISFYEISRQRS